MTNLYETAVGYLQLPKCTNRNHRWKTEKDYMECLCCHIKIRLEL